MFRPVFSLSSSPRLRHTPREEHSRHCHREGFLALVISGRYCEIGDAGVIHAEPGDVICHSPYEAHLNRVSDSGAEVLLLPISHYVSSSLMAIEDVDQVIRISELDQGAAADFVLRNGKTKVRASEDWPAELASALRSNPGLSIEHWIGNRGLSPSFVSRQFRKVFECSPSQFRLKSKVHLALSALCSSSGTITEVAHSAFFADHAHMCRAVRTVTGRTPSEVRSDWFRPTAGMITDNP